MEPVNNDLQSRIEGVETNPRLINQYRAKMDSLDSKKKKDLIAIILKTILLLLKSSSNRFGIFF